MSDKREAVDFEDLLAQMKADSEVPLEGWPTITGGKCAEGDLLPWLQGLDLTKMDTRIWQFTDRCTIGPEGPPVQVKWLERARLFGEGGDLDIRRNGREFLWRFVGKKDYAPEGKPLDLPTNGGNPVYQRERTALLWGERKEGQPQWFDDRTAGAELNYPVDNAPARVQVRCYEYTQAGRTLGVWLRGLEEYNG